MENVEGHRLRILARNTATLGAANLFSRALMVILGILIARWVTEQDYGQFAQALAWTLVLGYLGNLGLERLITREMARAPAKAGRLIGEALALKLGGTILLAPMLVGFNALLGFQGQMTLLLYLLGAYNILDSFRLLFCAVFEGLWHMELELWLTSAEAIGIFVLSLAALWWGRGVIGVAWAHAVGGGLSVVLGYYLLKRLAPPAGLYRGNIWRLLNDALPFGLYTLFWLLYYRLPVGLIGLWEGDVAAGWFNAAYIIVINLMILPRIVLGSSFPLLAYGQGQERSFVPALGAQSARYLVLLAFPLAIGAGLAAPAIIRLLYGPAYGQAAGVLRIASLGVPFAFSSTFFDGVLGAIDRQRQCTLIRGAMLILLVGLSWLLVRRLGYQGAAWAFVLVEAATCLILYLALVWDIQWRSLIPALWKAGLASAVMAGGMWAGREAFVLWRLGLGAGLYVLALWVLRAFSPVEVSVARALWQRAGGAIKKKG